MWDAVVAGAGPAGTVAAYVLARKGHHVLLADPVDPTAPKVGEALPGAAVRLLRSIGLPAPGSAGPHTPIGGNLSSWNSNQLVASDFFRGPDGPGWRLDRASFDAQLRAAAVDAGASFRPVRVLDVDGDDGGYAVRLKDGVTENARWIIDATGRRATIARRLGARRARDARLIALYATSACAAGFRLDRTVIEAVPRGWWYAARLPSGAAVAGFHTLHGDASQLLASGDGWRGALADTRHVGPLLADAVFAHPPQALEACGSWLDRSSGNRWIACGDAALAFDPLSGQGIFSALYGGMIAGQAVDDALDGRGARLDAYARRLQDIRRRYVLRWSTAYRSERRWPGEPFWSTFSYRY